MFFVVESTQLARQLQQERTHMGGKGASLRGIHTASVPVPSTAGTSTGGGAVLGKPEGSPARRPSRNLVLE